MPPAAALECERTGWTLLMMATVAPAPAAASAARWPASPAPIMRTSCAGMAGETIRGTGPLRLPAHHALCARFGRPRSPESKAAATERLGERGTAELLQAQCLRCTPGW